MRHDVTNAAVWDFPATDTGNGLLTMFQEGPDALPFAIGKVLTIAGMKKTDVRGDHAHKTMAEIVVAVRGGCDVEVDDGKTTRTFRLNDPQKALFLPPHVWRTLTNFDEGTVLLAIADRPYDESDYIRDRNEFLRTRS